MDDDALDDEPILVQAHKVNNLETPKMDEHIEKLRLGVPWSRVLD
jgi:hypothetical protein